jgi:hypothetical protein
MAAIQFRQRRVRRWWYLGMTVATAAALAVLFVGGAGASLPGSTFGGGDGNLTCNDANGALDWNCLSTSGSPQLHIGVEQFTGQQDNSFGQGTKEDDSNVSLVDGGVPPNKSDLTRFYEASEVLPVSGSDHVFLYLAWERTNVLGSANMDFEVNKTATPCLSTPVSKTAVKCTINRSVGDILVTYDFTGGGGTPTIGLRTWNGSSWQVDSTVVSESAVNTGTVSDTHLPAGSQDLAANTFGEVAIDLTASGQATGCGFANATTFLKSRSSAQFTSEVKDFVAPVSTPISPCAPTITTTLSANPVPVGSTVHDSAALTGATSDAGGTVTYRYYSSLTDCDADTTGTGGTGAGTVTVTNGIVPDSDPVTFNSPGTFYWKAFYSGDAKNSGDASVCADETLVVTSFKSSMTSAQSFIPNDSATISAPGGGDLAGTVTFDLYESSDCSGTAIYQQQPPVPVSGASPQTVHTTNTTVSTTAANVSWKVSYDSTNPAQDDIPATCFEKTALSINNDGTITSP